MYEMSRVNVIVELRSFCWVYFSIEDLSINLCVFGLF